MENLKLFIQLTRLDKPIGYMLLFWPCLWGLTIAYDFEKNLESLIEDETSSSSSVEGSILKKIQSK